MDEKKAQELLSIPDMPISQGVAFLLELQQQLDDLTTIQFEHMRLSAPEPTHETIQRIAREGWPGGSRSYRPAI